MIPILNHTIAEEIGSCYCTYKQQRVAMRFKQFDLMYVRETLTYHQSTRPSLSRK